MNFRSRYEYGDDSPGVDCSKDALLTKQAHRDECDINFILKGYEKTGRLPDLIAREPRYGDFSSSGSFQEALNTVLEAEEQFANLNASVRKRFDNDPAKFLAFAENGSNAKEMIEMGLAVENVEKTEKAKKAKQVVESSAPSSTPVSVGNGGTPGREGPKT